MQATEYKPNKNEDVLFWSEGDAEPQFIYDTVEGLPAGARIKGTLVILNHARKTRRIEQGTLVVLADGARFDPVLH